MTFDYELGEIVLDVGINRIAVVRPFRLAPRRRKSTQSRPGVPGGSPVPRMAKLMALAIRFDQLLQNYEVASQAELARLGHVMRARLTQIMNLLNLAPDIQEKILLLPRLIAVAIRSQKNSSGRWPPRRIRKSNGGCGGI